MTLTGVLFMTLYLAGSVLAFVRHPIYGLMTYVGVFYLNPPMRWWGAGLPDLRWAVVASMVTLAAVLLRKEKCNNIPIMRHGIMYLMIAFLLWIGIQSVWALDQDMHQEMISMYLKFMIVIFLIYQCVDTELHLKMFLWAHVIGCFTLGWIAYTSYTGGRFEGFDAPGLAEANSGAMQLVTAAFFGASLFLAANTRAKIVLAGLLAFVANAIITTQSRSGFLSLGLGGLVFNFFSPPRYKKLIRVLSVLGIAAMLAITTDAYWARMRSLEHAGEKVEGVDTGEGRIVLVKAQWLMFKDYPFGCGHRCTAVLSPRYLDDSQLTGAAGQDRVRSSHNTFMSLVVEHGIFGAMFYFVYLLWVLSSLRKFSKAFRNSEGFMATLLPAIAAVAVAMTLGDMFVDYLTFEMRIWIMAILMVLVSMATKSLQLAVEERTRSGNFGPRIVPALSSDRLRAGN